MRIVLKEREVFQAHLDLTILGVAANVAFVEQMESRVGEETVQIIN
jgi:hypothetical protein